MSTLQKTLKLALTNILSALVRTLLRNGMAYGEFDQIARKCYTDIAFEHFAPAGKKQTVSNVAITTGLNRKEVKRMLELDVSQSDSKTRQYNRCIRVIGGWINDPDYLRADGLPKDLAYDSDCSFSSLVRKYSGDMPVAAMQKVLTKSGNICMTNDNHVRLLKHAYLPSDDPVEHINILGVDTAQLIDTINHNLTASDEDLRFQRKTSNHQVSSGAVPTIKRFLARKGQAFLEEVDQYLTEHETENGDTTELSISVFYHQSPPEIQD
ncbi:MAG: hypothetical protein GY820_07810 [Gammaproteobacteria bacterium]|nr:hypothetical protein [Gammaproteobacteria bacterium]